MKKYSFKNFFEGFGYSLNLNRFKIAFIGTFIALFLYGLFTWFGILTEDRDGFTTFVILGAILSYIVFSLTNGAVSKTIIAEKSKIDENKSTITYLKEKKWVLILVPITFILTITLIIGIQALIDFICKIPGIGHLIFSATFLVQFFMSMFAIFTYIVLILGIFLYPALIADKNTGIIETITGIFSIVKKKGLIVFLYNLLTSLFTFIFGVIMTLIITLSFIITNGLAGSIMKEEFMKIIMGIPKFFQVIISFLFHDIYRSFYYYGYQKVSFFFNISGFLYGLSIFLIVVGVVAYLNLLYNSFSSMVYLIVNNNTKESAQEKIINNEE